MSSAEVKSNLLKIIDPMKNGTVEAILNALNEFTAQSPSQKNTKYNTKCKCGSFNVTYSTVQTRSCDEGMSSKWYCKTCGSRWTA